MVTNVQQPSALWFNVPGHGEPFVLLHPGGSDSRALDPLIAELDGTYACFTPDQRAHGRSRHVPGPLTFEAMAANTVAFLERSAETPVHLLGYSDGAIVALYVALARPDLVRSLVFAAAVFHYEGWLPGVLDGEVPSSMGDSYGELSPDGRNHWPVVVEKLDALHAVAPALTMEASQKPALFAQLIRDFHHAERTNGLAPIRRASTSPPAEICAGRTSARRLAAAR